MPKAFGLTDHQHLTPTSPGTTVPRVPLSSGLAVGMPRGAESGSSRLLKELRVSTEEGNVRKERQETRRG